MNEFGIIRSTASIICNNYASKDFPSREIETTIASAYSKTHLFDTKYYENTEIIDNVKQRLKRGEPKNQVKKDLQSTDIPEQTIDAVIKKAEEGKDDEFWTKTEKGVIKIVPLQFKRYLEDNGFHKYSPEGSKSYVFVKITNNLIDHTSEKEIKDFVLDYLYQIEDVSIYNYFAEQTRLFKEEFLTLINTIDVYFIEDTSNTSYLYYKNCAVQVTGKKVITIDYVDLDGYVWKDQVIDRAYKDCITTECDYRQFISNVCNGDYKRILSMESVKITKDDTTDEIKIYDPEKSINYYVEIQDNVYSLFHSKGWKVAVIELTLKKYKERLERIKDSISREMNNNQSPKRLRMLTESRQQILRKYYKLTQKLN